MRFSVGVIAALLVAVIFDCYMIAPVWAQGATAQPPAIVIVSPVIEAQLPPGASFIGATEGARVTVVGSAVDGRVETMFVREGDEVTFVGEGPGPELVGLKSETIRSELAAAEAELLNRQGLLDELKASQPEELALLQATLDEATAATTLARRKFDMTANLFQRQGSATQQEFDEATASLEIAVQRQLAASAELRRFELVSQIRINQAQARVDSQTAEVDKLGDQLFKHTMRSPFSGVVVKQMVEVGDWVSRGQVVAEIVELETIHIRVFVPEEQISGLLTFVDQRSRTSREPVQVRVKIDALGGEEIPGELYRIIPQADQRSRAFPVLVKVKNQRIGNQFLIGAGMLAHAILPVGDSGLHMLVPKDAIVLGGRSETVMVVRETPMGLQAVAVPVVTGTAYDDLLVVQGDLQPGDKVVIEGNERLRPGQPVQILSEVPITVPDLSGDPPVSSATAEESDAATSGDAVRD